ncbi:bifunctional riboflavin kinase/FAD synthetase [Defluviitalea raffinosedens]|uniref:Riboflavin biosynthesis protein n=1 Tax=Defluviitalea raffinosedens TaxID=1450156 RepID=A0A7C8LL59_9FIRM|nr:bifunctional riboflavin kinase/FAD synthetase [Defluviitalea raffinosedens]KAE9637084.1 bifunctional riboflavin kinase/FAD synthetase [Defluviitalea raffinosedens]
MKYISNSSISQNQPSAVTLGNFDGIHLGHRKLIETVKNVSKEENYQSIVFSFYPHPQMVLKKDHSIKMIFSRSEKKHRLEQMGIDLYIEYPFTNEFADISAEEFVEEILIKQLHAKVIVIGSNNKFGKQQKGNAQFLKEREKKWGLKVIEIPPVLYQGEIISSTRVREELSKGNISKVNELLGIPYIIMGKVLEGKKLGNTFGYPTANIAAEKDRIYPPNGVYLTRTKWNGKYYHSVTNIGYNPTVNGKNKVIETYIIDFNSNLYNEVVEIEFYQWIRSEQKFSNVEELIKQMKKDVDLAKTYFANF